MLTDVHDVRAPAPRIDSYRTTAQILQHAAECALRAPSVHNTQPWSFAVSSDRLTIKVDPTRRLRVLDPSGRQMIISCGCALFNARAAIAAAGLCSRVITLPDGDGSDVIAHVAIDRTETRLSDDDRIVAGYEPVIELRRTNRRQFAIDGVPPSLVRALDRAAEHEGARLIEVRGADDRHTVAALARQAGAAGDADPAALPGTDQTLVLLGTDGDLRLDWVRAGEALERVLLEIGRHGYAASPLIQVVEHAATRAELRSALQLDVYPQAVVRVGRATATPRRPLRRLDDVLEVN